MNIITKNTGDCSVGSCSTGNRSTGYASTGNVSTGDRSTGNHSSGCESTGDQSQGNGSTGNCSTGHLSTGNWSTGSHSTGNWSTSNYSSGHFCTIDGLGFSAFNKPIHKDIEKAIKKWGKVVLPAFLFFSINVWVWEKDMSDLEKDAHPSHKVTGGYLKELDFKEEFSKAVLGASKDELRLLKKLPNFDADVFLEISGVDVRSLPAFQELGE